MYFGFSWIGLAIFMLPMIFNILYVVFPPKTSDGKTFENGRYPRLERIESLSRSTYAAVICIFISSRPLNFKSPFLYISLVFLVLYYIVWIRYFISGRDTRLLGKSFLHVPQPLAVFPVLYFISASIWMNNPIALAIMIVFGISHNMVTYRNLKVRR